MYTSCIHGRWGEMRNSKVMSLRPALLIAHPWPPLHLSFCRGRLPSYAFRLTLYSQTGSSNSWYVTGHEQLQRPQWNIISLFARKGNKNLREPELRFSVGFPLRAAEYATPKIHPRSFRTCHLTTAASVFWFSWALGSWKLANAQRGFLWTSLTYLPKDRHATGTQLPQIRFWEFQQPGTNDPHHRRGDWKSAATHANYHASLHLSKGSFTIPKDHLLSPKRAASRLSFSY